MSNAISLSDTEKQSVVLLLQVPRTNDKKELAAEQMFASLYGLLTTRRGFLQSSTHRQHISLEIAVLQRKIGFYVWVPSVIKDFVEDQIYAQYPNVQISEVPDYSLNIADESPAYIAAAELRLNENQALPIKTFQSFEVDPLAAITGTLAKFNNDEQAWIQLIIRPATANWHRKSEAYISRIKGGYGNRFNLLGALWSPPANQPSGGARQLAEYEQTRIRSAEEKSQKLAYETCIRIVYISHNPAYQTQLKLQSITASYHQFNSTYLNGFSEMNFKDSNRTVSLYQQRAANYHNTIMNIEELATLYHLPHTNVETPYILWASSQTAEPPANLPLLENNEISGSVNVDLISPVGITNFRGHNSGFGMPRVDRGRHLYIIGQTGVGKSALLELLTIADLSSAYGFAVIDPHGDYAQSVLRRIPEERINDVIYFNPADTDFPMSFNPMEVTDPKLKTHTASELIGVLKRMFDSWGPRLEYILRYSLLALLDYPESTMLDITRILTDDKFRKEVLNYVNDTVVANFWRVEFNSWNNKFAVEAVAPILNKVGAFTANPLVRNIIAQPKSSFNIRQIMDEKKILIVNLTRGIVGEDNAAILGSLLVTKIQLAAMSRADTPVEMRHPFYLYVDEFQNFATDSFATILSEARKYGLSLTVANQYIAQMSQEIRDAIFGNVGTLMSFRLGADDALKMQRYFDPSFNESDLINMHNRHFVISMTIEGEKVRPFSAITLDLPPYSDDFSDTIINHSRSLYARSQETIEQYIHGRYNNDKNQPKPQLSRSPDMPSNTKPVPNLLKSIVQTDYLPTQDVSIPNPPANQAEPAKKKRRRRRRKHTNPDNTANSEISLKDQPDNFEHTFKIR